MKGLLGTYLKILRSTFCERKKEVRCANVRCAGIQRLTDYDAISYRIVKMLIKMNLQTLNDDIVKAYGPVSPEINEIAASGIIWIIICNTELKPSAIIYYESVSMFNLKSEIDLLHMPFKLPWKFHVKTGSRHSLEKLSLENGLIEL